jgi:HEPN domain-containing protein
MKQPEQVVRDLVEGWLAKAEVDYRAAQSLMRDAEPIRDAIAFHCQQAAEKYLKAFLVRHQAEFPKTHNLEQLLELVAPIAPELAASLEETEVLSPYGVDIRYPGDFPELLPGQENTVFELAGRAREAVIAQLASFLSGGEPGTAPG